MDVHKDSRLRLDFALAMHLNLHQVAHYKSYVIISEKKTKNRKKEYKNFQKIQMFYLF